MMIGKLCMPPPFSSEATVPPTSCVEDLVNDLHIANVNNLASPRLPITLLCLVV